MKLIDWVTVPRGFKVINKTVAVVAVKVDSIEFEQGYVLSSHHSQDCCEEHYLFFSDLDLSDFDGLVFDLSTDSFFNRIKDYGIELVPVSGHTIKVPAYASNNGYYSSELDLVLTKGNRFLVKFDIQACQIWG